MTVIYTNQENNFSANTVASQYDLIEEKKIIAETADEFRKELSDKWKKTYLNAEIFPPAVASMHPEIINFLLSFNLVTIYDNIARQANFDAKGRNILPHVVWKIAQTKSWGSLDQALESQLPLVHSAHVQVAQLLEQNILSKIRALSEKPFTKKTVVAVEAKKEIQLSLPQALQQYPKIGEQNITNNPLRLRYFPNSVRPSIKNWITDFHDNMGAGKHGAVDRGNYLFHSENGKKLTPVERQKLSTILKSLDENSLLIINPSMQSIVFQEMNIHQPMISGQGTVIKKDTSNEEQQDIFQKNEWMKTIPQGPSLNEKKEEPQYASALEGNYFQIPKYKPEIDSKPKIDMVSREDKAPIASKNYSPNFKNIIENNFSSEQKIENANQDKLKEHIVTEGKLSFSSPQKFPVEQEVENAENKTALTDQQKVISSPAQINEIVQPQKKPIFQSQWKIRPSTYFNEEEGGSNKSMRPKIKGNVVDLKN